MQNFNRSPEKSWNLITNNKNLNRNEKIVCHALTRCFINDYDFYQKVIVSLRKLETITGLSRPTIIKIIDKLVNKDYLSKEMRWMNSKYLGNKYNFLKKFELDEISSGKDIDENEDDYPRSGRHSKNKIDEQGNDINFEDDNFSKIEYPEKIVITSSNPFYGSIELSYQGEIFLPLTLNLPYNLPKNSYNQSINDLNKNILNECNDKIGKEKIGKQKSFAKEKEKSENDYLEKNAIIREARKIDYKFSENPKNKRRFLDYRLFNECISSIIKKYGFKMWSRFRDLIINDQSEYFYFTIENFSKMWHIFADKLKNNELPEYENENSLLKEDNEIKDFDDYFKNAANLFDKLIVGCQV